MSWDLHSVHSCWCNRHPTIPLDVKATAGSCFLRTCLHRPPTSVMVLVPKGPWDSHNLWPNNRTMKINLGDFRVLHFLTKTHREIMCLKNAKQNTNGKQHSITVAHVHWQRCADWTFAQFQLHHGLYDGFAWTYRDSFQVVAVFTWKHETSCNQTVWMFPKKGVPLNHPFSKDFPS